MQDTTVKTKTETFGLPASESFKVEANAFMFETLFKNIYSRPVDAGVRETISNAWDSHQKAGKADEPVVVHVPNEFEPFFSVRDFGISMTDAEVFKLYTTLFGSGSRGTDLAQGMYGLGSAAPFAYTQSFTVTCWMDGRERLYSCFLNNSIPQVVRIHDVESDEPQGVLINIPVEMKDLGKFREACNVMAQSVIPTPIGLTRPFSNDQHLVVDGMNVELSFSTSNGGLFVRQGCVTYPVDNYRVQLRNASHSRRLTVEVPIGTVNVTASRESLQMDERTVANLKVVVAKLDAALEALRKEQMEEAKKITKRLDRMRAYEAWARLWETRSPEPNIAVAEGRDRFEGAFSVIEGYNRKSVTVVRYVEPKKEQRIWFGNPNKNITKKALINSYRKGTDIIFTGSREELKRAVRILGAIEVITIDSLKPPKAPKAPRVPAPRAPRGSKPKPTWPTLAGGTTETKPNMDTVWVAKVDKNKMESVQDLVEFTGYKGDIVIIIASAEKYVDPANNAYDVVSKLLHTPESVAAAMERRLVGSIYHKLPYDVRGILTECGVVEYPSGGSYDWTILNKAGLINETGTDAKAKIIVDDLKKKYPVLFNGFDKKQYVLDIIAAEAATTNTTQEG